MKSQKSVGRAFTDVWEAFSEHFSPRNADFQLAGLLPTFGERFFATRRGENLVRQAPSAPGAQRGVPLRRAQEADHTMHPGRRAARRGMAGQECQNYVGKDRHSGGFVCFFFFFILS